jgi:hypothetical protein
MTSNPEKRKTTNARYYQKRKIRNKQKKLDEKQLRDNFLIQAPEQKQKRNIGIFLEGFNHATYDRDTSRIIYAYNSTCYDCKTKILTDYQIHHDFNTMPITVLFLCKSCHAKRHGCILTEVKN